MNLLVLERWKSKLKRNEHIKNVQREIGIMREWLDRVERDTANETVIHAMLLMSLSESCAKVIYEAGMINGKELVEE